MTTALYAGSFDPVTNGHIDVLETASKIFDKVIIAVAYNSEKKSFLSVEQRVELIKKAVSNFRNVKVDSYFGLTANYAKENGVNFLVRGLRNASDFEAEIQMAQINESISENIKTVFLSPKLNNSFISSSMVREIYNNKGDISQYVPACVSEYLK